jgi:hypothetical protein
MPLWMPWSLRERGPEPQQREREREPQPGQELRLRTHTRSSHPCGLGTHRSCSRLSSRNRHCKGR